MGGSFGADLPGGELEGGASVPSRMNLAESPRTIQKAMIYVNRALRWKCPTCGEKPMFLPWYKVRSLHDWFSPLDGCPNCGYAYDREPGYFLLALWGVNYGFVAVVGMTAYISIRQWTDWSTAVCLWVAMGPAPLLSILVARHAKSFFLAMDHFCDPHIRDKKFRKKSD
jgi:uncharacterized protein (DUF983 family)